MYKSLPHHKSGGYFFALFSVVKLHKTGKCFLCKVLKTKKIYKPGCTFRLSHRYIVKPENKKFKNF